MLFNSHSNLVGTHAFLSASKYHWINYSEHKLEQVFINAQAAAKGDRLHQLAHDCIREKIKLAANGTTLSMYVNDAIGFRMTPEQILYYSDNAYGCADAIGFYPKKRKLRIHDLKTGITPASVHQLEVYAAYFCLEYMINPFDIEMELRIYQNDDKEIYVGDPDTILHIMDKIKVFDARINEMKLEVLS